MELCRLAFLNRVIAIANKIKLNTAFRSAAQTLQKKLKLPKKIYTLPKYHHYSHTMYIGLLNFQSTFKFSNNLKLKLCHYD